MPLILSQTKTAKKLKTLMKKLLFILPLCSIALSIQAQSSLRLTAERNAYRAGDELQKQQVVFRDPGSSGRNLTWDFRHLQVINDEYALRYFIPDSAYIHIICGLEHRTRYYYSLLSDSLWAIGFQNATTFMEYTQPELRMVFPFTFGDVLYSNFEGTGEYGRRLHLSVRGFTRVEADAEGELILPDETVKRALRVRTTRHYTETRMRQTTSPAFGTLSKGEGTVENGVDSTEMILDTYSWYAQGMRYPVFESIKTTVLRNGADTTVFETSFYYPPIEQRIQTESLSEEELEGTEWLEGAAAVFTEAVLLPNPVVDVLYINYKLTRDARISFSVHNNAGVLMTQTTAMNKTEGYHQTPVNMTGFITGVYTLYVHVDDMVLNLNVVKR